MVMSYSANTKYFRSFVYIMTTIICQLNIFFQLMSCNSVTV